MKEEVREVLKNNLKLPRKFLVYEEVNGVCKPRLVSTEIDHFINWIDSRVTFSSIWDYTLKMIESCFELYTKNEKVIEYYLSKRYNS